MRILLVTATYPPSTNGVAISVKNLKGNFEKLGYKVLVLAPENPVAKEEKGVIRYPSLPNPFVKDYPIPLFPGVKAIYELVMNFKPDIVHVHHPIHVGFFAKLIADQFKVPLVFTFHTRYDLYAEKYVTLLPKKLKSEFVANNIYNFCKETDLVIAPSNFISDEIQKNLPYLNVVTIPTGISEFKFGSETKNELRIKYKVPTDKKVLLSVSRLGREKNVETLVKSAKYFPGNFLLLIAGSGPDAEQLKEISLSEKVQNKVRFLGKIEHNKIHDIYRLSDYFYYASETETQGLIFLEAITFGLPVIAVDSDASREWVKPDFGILSKNSPEELAKSALLLSKKNITKLSIEAKRFASNYSGAKQAKKLLKAYIEVAKRKNLTRKLLDTGWQSWSPKKKNITGIPAWNYKPNKDYYLPQIPVNVNLKKPITGWCSWYAFGNQINEKKIIDSAKWFSKRKDLPIDYILIDDGWTKWGDWDRFSKSRFPNGLKETASKIKMLGLKPGIWLAPFLVEPKSNRFRKDSGDIIQIAKMYVDGHRGFLSNIFFPRYILDVRKNEVMSSIKKNIDFLLRECKFELIKLDFLYSIFFIPGITEKEAGYRVREIFEYVKTQYPDVYTIACGAPLSSVVGVTDSTRIGPDIISPEWSIKPVIGPLINSYRIRRVIGNIDERMWTKKYWNLDPDVFVCSDKLGLSTVQIVKLREKIKESNGNIFLGDDMAKLSKERINKYILPLFK